MRRLQIRGYTVDVPPNLLRGLPSDSAYIAAYMFIIDVPIGNRPSSLVIPRYGNCVDGEGRRRGVWRSEHPVARRCMETGLLERSATTA